MLFRSEREKKSMGRARYLIRILVVLEFPTLFVCLLSVMYSVSSNSSNGLMPLWLLAWLLALMIVTVKGSTLISSERTRETLDALLSTPLTGRDILLQKVAGMRRLLLVLSTPILTVNLTLVMMTVQSGLGVSLANLNQLLWLLTYAVLSVFSTWTTLQLLAWLAVLVGSRARAQTRSVFTAVAVALGLAGCSWFLVGQEPIFAGQITTGYGDRLRPASEVAVGNAIRQAFRIDGSLQATQSLLWSMAPRSYGSRPASASPHAHTRRTCSARTPCSHTSSSPSTPASSTTSHSRGTGIRCHSSPCHAAAGPTG